MSDPRALLDALDEAHAKATPGPWRVTVTGGTDLFTGEGYREVEVEFDDPLENAGLILGEHENAEADAAAIVAAHNALPALTAAVRAALDLADADDERAHVCRAAAMRAKTIGEAHYYEQIAEVAEQSRDRIRSTVMAALVVEPATEVAG